ncbi:helix-turn-helix domain-containing protein [Actinomadura rupiterrae]|uniref:helix-turn-helix domain-containing protein n=1 Tax=Actinomadura rupiterrae TaxID=559627 RepID=UPI0020A4C16B|nr:helix-turn-helix transcriptional regulator [Actinomadura rupiterrae]MCP2341222.1 transcriptional regulator with XRE-family HTH domain [Actinomadura rupiterrae]
MLDSDQQGYRRRRIGTALRKFREERGLTQERAAHLVERSPATLSAYENGHRAIRPRDLRQILDHYGIADGRLRRQLLELAADGRRGGWWRDYRGAEGEFIVDFASLEADSSRIWSFEPQVVPGLLQTREYTQAIFDVYSGLGATPPDPRAVEFRMQRQRILQRPSTRVFWVVHEAALRLTGGPPEIMRAQCQKILRVTEAENLELRVLPFTAGLHPGLEGAFSILDVGDDEPMQVVALHSATSNWFVDDQEKIEFYEKIHVDLAGRALSKVDSRALIQQVASET